MASLYVFNVGGRIGCALFGLLGHQFVGEGLVMQTKHPFGEMLLLAFTGTLKQFG